MTPPGDKAVRHEVSLTSGTVQLLRDEMRAAVSEGLGSMMTPENAQMFWETGLKMLRDEAASRTGRLIGDAALGLLKRVTLIGVFVVIVYSVGGWHGLTSMAKVLFGEK